MLKTYNNNQRQCHFIRHAIHSLPTPFPAPSTRPTGTFFVLVHGGTKKNHMEVTNEAKKSTSTQKKDLPQHEFIHAFKHEDNLQETGK